MKKYILLIIVVVLCFLNTLEAQDFERNYLTDEKEIYTVEDDTLQKYEITNLSYVLGSHPIHSGSRLTFDSKSLYFFKDTNSTTEETDKDHLGSSQDIYISHLEEGYWTVSSREDELCNYSNNGVQFISKDGERLLLLGRYRDDKTSDLGLSMVHYDLLEKRWSKAIDQKVKNMNLSVVSSYYMNEEEDVLLLSLERKKQDGGNNIYVSFKEDRNKWSEPVSLGDVINTNGSEGTMSLSPDSKTLYFSSNGRSDSYGGFDIYKSERLDDSWLNWSTPVHMPKPYNSAYNDLYYTRSIDGSQEVISRGYLRANGHYCSDILSISPVIEESQDCAELQVNLDAYPTHEHVEAKIMLEYDGHVLDVFDNQEWPQIRKMVEGKTYKLVVESDKYLHYEREIVVDCERKKQIIDIELKPKDVNISWEIENVFFEYDSDVLLETSFESLDKVRDILIKDNDLLVEIAGHTDARGHDVYNMNLSHKRAEAIVKYLVDHGVSTDRLTAKGYGESILKNTCGNGVACSEDLHQENRRVEFQIIGLTSDM